jgi:membrane protease YdiL (CAAX protease family)
VDVGRFWGFAPLDNYFIRTLFSWLPAWSTSSTSLADMAQYSSSALLATFWVGLALNGIAGPLVEELYFRGYLLPRIPSRRGWLR